MSTKVIYPERSQDLHNLWHLPKGKCNLKGRRQTGGVRGHPRCTLHLNSGQSYEYTQWIFSSKHLEWWRLNELKLHEVWVYTRYSSYIGQTLRVLQQMKESGALKNSLGDCLCLRPQRRWGPIPCIILLSDIRVTSTAIKRENNKLHSLFVSSHQHFKLSKVPRFESWISLFRMNASRLVLFPLMWEPTQS